MSFLNETTNSTFFNAGTCDGDSCLNCSHDDGARFSVSRASRASPLRLPRRVLPSARPPMLEEDAADEAWLAEQMRPPRELEEKPRQPIFEMTAPDMDEEEDVFDAVQA